MSSTETSTDTADQAVDTSYPFAAVPANEAVQRYIAIAADRPMTKMTMPIGGDVWVIHRNAAAREMLSDPPIRARALPDGCTAGTLLRRVPGLPEVDDPVRGSAAPHQTSETRAEVDFPPEARARDARICRRIRQPSDRRNGGEGHVGESGERLRRGVADPDAVEPDRRSPPEDRPKFQKWSAATLAVANMPEEEVVQNMTELFMYLMALIEDRRKNPREDLLSDLANAPDKDDSLTDGEILPIAMILIVAGFDNTANFICSGVLSLLRNPEQLAVLLEDVDAVAPTAVEEILRNGRMAIYDTVAGGGGLVPFVATEDVEIDGQLIAEGEAVLVDPAASITTGSQFRTPGPSMFAERTTRT